MWVHLEPPHGWVRDDAEGWRRARRPGGGILLEWSPLRLLPDEPGAWFDAVLARGRPAGAAGGRRRVTERRSTVTGWDVVLVETAIDTGGGGVAPRLAAFYAFLEHGGSALVHADDRAAWDAEIDGLRAILLAARPDLRGPLLSIEHFYAGVDDG